MANQGSKQSLDGIVRTKPANQGVVRAKPVEPIAPPPPKPPRLQPRPVVAEPPQPVLAESSRPAEEEVVKKSRFRKIIKTVVVLLVLATFGFGIWWVYLSYFA